MSKWNNGASYSMDSIPEEEVLEAIEEWSEGSEILKRLLLECYKRKIDTFGCHYGPGAYIDFEGTKSIGELKKMARNIGDLDKTQLLVMEEIANPRILIKQGSTASVSMGVLQDSREAGDTLFTRLSEGLELDCPPDIAMDRFFDFYEAFEGKESGLIFRLRKSKDEGYRFYIESREKNYGFSYCDELFTKAGLTRDVLEEDAPIVSWSVGSHDKAEFDQMMERAYDVIAKGWQLDVPTEISDEMSFMMKLRIMYKKLGGTTEGKQELYNWTLENMPEQMLKLSGLKRPSDGEGKGRE